MLQARPHKARTTSTAEPELRTRAERPPLLRIDRFFQWSLLGMLAAGFLAVAASGELDGLTIALVSLALSLRIALLLKLVTPPARSEHWVTWLSLLYVLFYPLDYWYLSQTFLSATVHMICFVASVKIVTAKSERDYAFVKMIAMLELLAGALLSAGPAFFVCLGVFLLFTISTFASGEVRRSASRFIENQTRRSLVIAPARGFGRRLGFLTSGVFAGVLLMTAGMFFVLPRTARAAFQRFVPQNYHGIGLSNDVTLGELGELTPNSTPVMHVRAIQDGSGSRANLFGAHWRGSTLSYFDGTRWSNPKADEVSLRVDHGELVLGSVERSRPGRTVGYDIQLEPMASDTLVFAGIPETIRIQAPTVWRSPSGSLRVRPFETTGLNSQPFIRQGLRYGAYSFLPNDLALPTEPPAALTSADREALLQLPTIDPRVAQLTRDWTASNTTAWDQARSLENHLRRDFSYSLKLLDEPVQDPLANFLFVRKQGHCEYFASAMAVMLRTLGIPSRVATGFLGGIYNPMTGWQIVRASDAHSWVEAWIPGRGWTTFDPTPSDPSAPPVFLGRVALYLDAADQFWRDWVMDYDLEHQVVLAGQLQNAGRNFRFPAIFDRLFSNLTRTIEQLWFDHWFAAGWSGNSGSQLWFGALLALIIAFAVIWIYFARWQSAWRDSQRIRRIRSGHAQPSDATLLYERALTLLERRGFQRPPWLTPEEFARVLPATELGRIFGELTHTYNQLRFGRQPEAAPRMATLVGNLEALLAK